MVLANQVTIFGTGFDNTQPNFLELMKISLIITGLFLSSIAFAWQDDALIRFQLNYSDDYRLSVRDINTVLDDAEAEVQSRDRVVELFIGEMYRIFEEEYAAKLGLNPMDLSDKADLLQLDPYGFPQLSGKKAAKRLRANRFFAVEIMMDEAQGLITSESDERGLNIDGLAIKGDRKKFRPRVEVRLIIFKANGKRDQTARAAAKADKKIVLKESTFFNVVAIGKGKSLEESQEVLLDTYRKALDKVVKKL